jgi:hypothetical protein
MIPPSQQPDLTSAFRLGNTLQLTFLDDPLMGFAGALDPILIVTAFGRQEVYNLVDTACTAAAERPGCKTHRLTHFEFVLIHRTLHS